MTNIPGGVNHRKKRTVPEKQFKDEESLLKYSLEVLVKAGLSIEQVDRLRNRRELGQVFDKENTRIRRYATAELLAANLSNAQIAKVFKLSKETVNADRQHIRQTYIDGILATADQWRARLLDEQDLLKAKALESFEASKRKVVKRVQERNGDEIVTIEEHSLAGESSFLTVAKGCLEQQARLLGLFDTRPRSQDGEEKSYKKFLSQLSQEVKKISQAETNAQDRAVAIEAVVELDEDGEPIGNSRPMLPAQQWDEDDGEDEEDEDEEP